MLRQRIIFLSNGRQCPVIGLGTWRTPTEVTKQAVRDAIDVGYRHIDCAHSYGNHVQVGEALKEAFDEGAIKRDEIFITSKLWNTHHRPEVVRSACEQTLNELGLTYLDLYLIHWPMGYKESNELQPKDENGKIIFSDIDYVDTWSAVEELVSSGLCRAIGLSNFNQLQIERVLSIAHVPVTMLQIECHPYLNQRNLMEFCNLKGIQVTAYSPLGSPHSPYTKPGAYPLLQHPVILEIAKAYKLTAADILIAYQLQRHNIVVTRSVNKEHMKTNFKAGQLVLNEAEMAQIDALDFNGRFMTMEVASGHPYHPFEENEKTIPLEKYVNKMKDIYSGV